MIRLGILVATLIATGACASGADNPLPDYTPDAPTSDAGDVDMGTGDSNAACTKARSVFLNFGPQQLTRSADVSDAKMNTAAWIETVAVGATVTAPGRTASVTEITTAVTTALMPYGIEVVTTRPASGEYQMVVFGGTPGTVGVQSFGGAVQRLDCDNVVASDVAWIEDGFSVPQTVNWVLGAVGFGVGLNATTSQADCMCGWGNTCQQNQACTFSLLATDQSVAANLRCPGVMSQDAPAKIRDGFCQ